MAPGLKWSILVGVGLVAALLLIETANPDWIRPQPLPPETRRYFAAQREYRQAVSSFGQLKRMERAHEIMADRDARLVYLSPAIADSLRNRIEPQANDAVQGLATSKVRIRLAVLPRDTTLMWESARPFEMYAARGPEPFCLALYAADRRDLIFGQIFLRESHGWTSVRGSFVSNALGPCEWWARYGVPGPGIHEWLKQGGYAFADGRAEWLIPDPQRRDPGVIWSARLLRRYDYFSERYARRCRAGDAEECLRLFLTPEKRDLWGLRVHDTAADFARDNWPLRTFGPGDVALLAHIERAFGAEKFAQFWASTDDVPQAFEKAFGVAPGWWLAGWAQQHYGTAAVGPGMKFLTLLLSLIAIALLGGVAIMAGARRTVTT